MTYVNSDVTTRTCNDVAEHLLEDLEVAAVCLLQQFGHAAHGRLAQLKKEEYASDIWQINDLFVSQ